VEYVERFLVLKSQTVEAIMDEIVPKYTVAVREGQRLWKCLAAGQAFGHGGTVSFRSFGIDLTTLVLTDGANKRYA
jgi:hypothetical protein